MRALAALALVIASASAQACGHCRLTSERFCGPLVVTMDAEAVVEVLAGLLKGASAELDEAKMISLEVVPRASAELNYDPTWAAATDVHRDIWNNATGFYEIWLAHDLTRCQRSFSITHELLHVISTQQFGYDPYNTHFPPNYWSISSIPQSASIEWQAEDALVEANSGGCP